MAFANDDERSIQNIKNTLMASVVSSATTIDPKHYIRVRDMFNRIPTGQPFDIFHITVHSLPISD